MSPAFAGRSRNGGFTMIELMVAMTIGLVLTAAIASLFLHSRSTYGATDELSRIQEGMRYAHTLMGRMIHQAGYLTAPNAFRDAEEAPTGSGATVVFDTTNRAFSAVDGGSGGSPSQALPDQFTVSFQGSGSAAGAADGSVTDCLGRSVAAGQTAVNTFRVATSIFSSNPALWCDSTLNGAGPNAGFLSYEVVADVQNMQVVFGEDLTDSQDGSTRRDGAPERFLQLSQIGTANVDKVVSLRIALLFRTPNVASNVVAEARTYDVNGNTLGPYSDTRQRRILTATFNLRNRSWAVYR